EHLLSKFSKKPVAIVEGQSTMLFMAILGKAASKYQIPDFEYFSQFNWISTGGSDGIGWKDKKVTNVLKGKDIILFPDTGFFHQWLYDSEILQEYGLNIRVSRLLESKYNSGFLKYNEDLRDFLMLFEEDIQLLCRSDILVLKTSSITSILGELHPGKPFNNLILACFIFDGTKIYDLLFDQNEEFIRPGEQDDAVCKFAIFFEKKIKPALIDGHPCWVHQVYS
ncbi:MAG: DUF6371 domain-containing protein, partial [Chitinophagaceae bacterium]